MLSILLSLVLACSGDSSEDTAQNVASEPRFVPHAADGISVERVEPARYLGLWYEIATTPSTKTAESAYYDAFETECRLCKELFDLLDDLKSKFDPARPFAPFDTTATHIIRDSLLRCEKLRNKYIREQQHPAKRGDYTFSRKEKTFLRALVLKALSLELQKIQVKRRGGIKRVGELVRATVSFKLRGGEKSSSGGRIPSPPPPRRRSSSVVLSQYA